MSRAIQLIIVVAVTTCAFTGRGQAAPPPVPPSYVATTYAGYGADSAADSVTAQVRVPTISCAAVPAGTSAGQTSGVQLISGNVHLTATIRTFCDGGTARYAAEFAVPTRIPASSPAALQSYVRPAHVAVHPGDVVELGVRTLGQWSLATIVDTTRPVSLDVALGRALTDASPYVVTTDISTNADGSIQWTGPAVPGRPGLPGPVTSSPISFSNVSVDGAPLAAAPDLFSVDWVAANDSSNVLAATLPITGRRSFDISVPA